MDEEPAKASQPWTSDALKGAKFSTDPVAEIKKVMDLPEKTKYLVEPSLFLTYDDFMAIKRGRNRPHF